LMASSLKEVEVLFEVESDDIKLLEAIRKAVVPDNINAPSEIRIDCETASNTFRVSVRLLGSNLLRLRNTIDDLLEQISIVVRVLGDSKRTGD